VDVSERGWPYKKKNPYCAAGKIKNEEGNLFKLIVEILVCLMFLSESNK